MEKKEKVEMEYKRNGDEKKLNLKWNIKRNWNEKNS